MLSRTALRPGCAIELHQGASVHPAGRCTDLSTSGRLSLHYTLHFSLASGRIVIIRFNISYYDT